MLTSQASLHVTIVKLWNTVDSHWISDFISTLAAFIIFPKLEIMFRYSISIRVTTNSSRNVLLRYLIKSYLISSCCVISYHKSRGGGVAAQRYCIVSWRGKVWGMYVRGFKTTYKSSLRKLVSSSNYMFQCALFFGISIKIVFGQVDQHVHS